MADFATVDVFSFSRSLEGSNEEVEKEVALLQRVVTFQVLKGVVFGTPVDTGAARGDWQVTIDKPAESEANRLDPNGSTTLSAGFEKLRDIEPFGVSYVTNNKAYIVPLEEGHSPQARGFVAGTVARVQAQFI